MELAHMVGILPKNGALHVTCTDHVVRHQQEFFAVRPSMLRDHTGQLRYRTRLRIACQNQVQNRHKVTLTRAKTAM